MTKAEQKRKATSKQAERLSLTVLDIRLDVQAVLMFFKLCRYIETITTGNIE
jgi:hypothetical protein